jgi:hypothetical protein
MDGAGSALAFIQHQESSIGDYAFVEALEREMARLRAK